MPRTTSTSAPLLRRFKWPEGRISSNIWRYRSKKLRAATTTFLVFLLFLVITVLLTSSNYNKSYFTHDKGTNQDITTIPGLLKRVPKRLEIPLNCSMPNITQTCPANYPAKFDAKINDDTCPDYFRWIHEDLKPFKATGITKEMVNKGKNWAVFRLVILKGKVYVKNYKPSIQTRDVTTLWGILQLLRRYPGRLPDLDLMFDTNDRPTILARDHAGPNATAPPPLLRYCSDQWSLDIVFPDWSFWGWHEINIKPWESIIEEIREGNKEVGWVDREPYAYWKGNPVVAPTRGDLLKCNVTDKENWNSLILIQDWQHEEKTGYSQSNLAKQCTHRYKNYIEGWAWSVSEKYILACDSLTLFVKTQFHDFFLRTLQPLQHCWPIKDDDKCRSLKFAVEWANNHTQEAQAMGKAASDFMQHQVKMEYVYDYMFHLLNGYGKLLKYVPKVPKGAIELCSETMACRAEGVQKKFMMESLEKGPSITIPCTMPPPFEPHALEDFMKIKAKLFQKVSTWEKKYWERLSKQ